MAWLYTGAQFLDVEVEQQLVAEVAQLFVQGAAEELARGPQHTLPPLLRESDVRRTHRSTPSRELPPRAQPTSDHERWLVEGV
jgi:hypothetical protein